MKDEEMNGERENGTLRFFNFLKGKKLSLWGEKFNTRL